MRIVLSIGGIILAAATGASLTMVTAQTTELASSARSADCAEAPARCLRTALSMSAK